MRREWPMLLIASALLLGAAAQIMLNDDSGGVLGGVLMALGSAAFGAWLATPVQDTPKDEGKG